MKETNNYKYKAICLGQKRGKEIVKEGKVPAVSDNDAEIKVITLLHKKGLEVQDIELAVY